MATVTKFSGEVSSAYGKALDTAVRFEGEYAKLDKSDIDVIKASNEWPSDEDIILGYINPRRLAAARAKATTDALDNAGVKKPAADDPFVILRNLTKQLVLTGMSEADADTMARGILKDKLAAAGV